MLLLIWAIALLCIGLWSLACWGIAHLLAMQPADFQDLKSLADQWPYRDELDRWLPGWQTLLQFLLDLAQGLLAGLSNAAPWLVWTLWAIGAGLALLVAGLLTAAVLLLRKDGNKPPPALPSPR
ncbi:hypothetical protein [Piscinibacter sakaiensis]|uniref:hypothetical protein n=1 Tax=Piscinibacter sakaiensis TaxID=1547922 RepID=UPI003AAA6F8E